MSTVEAGGDPTLGLPTAHGTAPLTGRLRTRDEDFVVDEELGYAASGEGEHRLLQVRKRGLNTQDVVRRLARHAGVSPAAIGFAGLKDRHAVTTQHFSVQLPGRPDPDWAALADETLEVLSVERHHRKVRRGTLRANRFVIRVRDVQGDHASAEQTLRRIAVAGVPNYFGGQRFGRDGGNLQQLDDLFSGRLRRVGREQRSMLLSAARSQLFNAVLAERVADRSWDQGIDGDVMLLEGAWRQFRYDPDDASIGERLAALDVHPSGPLYGRPSRALQTSGAASRIEEAVFDRQPAWCAGLQRLGVDADRRALRMRVDELTWEWIEADLRLGFRLPAGSYATAVLRELVAATE